METVGTNKNLNTRLKFIEVTLRLRGWISRADLVEKFKISPPAATRDFKSYRELAPNNTIYSDTSKRYEINEESFRNNFDISYQEAITFIKNKDNKNIIGYGEFDSIQYPPRLYKHKTEVLELLSRAILNKTKVEVEYTSVRSGRSTKTIAPHSIVDNGMRWHVRAYDFEHSEFRDFVLSRFQSIKSSKLVVDKPYSRLEDHQWNRIVKIELTPHPNKKNMEHPEFIANDMGMENNIKIVTVRAAIAGYWLRMWNVDCSKDHSLIGKEYQLWLSNYEALYDVSSAFMAPGYLNN